MFFSTHILEVAERLCHRVGIIDEGKLIASGSMDELKKSVASGGESTLEELFLALTGGDESHGEEEAGNR